MAARREFDSIFRPGLLRDQVILVTGGGTGIGRCIAHELAFLGALPVLAGRRREPLERTRDEIRGADREADMVTLDIRDETAVDTTIREVVERHGRLDGVVNNAGGQFASPAAFIRPKGWRAVVDTNLNGTWFVSQAAFLHALSRSGGAIVNIVADMWNGFPGMAHTGAARAGVVNLTRTLAVEWAPSGVRVNAVAPGGILSSGLGNYPPEIQEAAARLLVKVPASRVGTESEVSAAVVFLLSPAAAYITGAVIKVDGGSSLQKAPLLPLVPHDRSKPWNGFHLASEVPTCFSNPGGNSETDG